MTNNSKMTLDDVIADLEDIVDDLKESEDWIDARYKLDTTRTSLNLARFSVLEVIETLKRIKG